MSSSGVQLTDHTYRDFSRYVEEGGKLISRKKSDNNFPAKLHRMLSDELNSHAIAWMPHGRAFKIVDKERLMTDVLPKYCVSKKYESFSRQLNGWGFKKLHQTGPDNGCWYHECFLRNHPEITCLIPRLPPKGKHVGRFLPFADGEPNLYLISKQFPLREKPPARSTSESREVGSFTAPGVQGSARFQLPSAVFAHQHSSTPVAAAGSVPPNECAQQLPSAPMVAAPAPSSLNYTSYQAGNPTDQNFSQQASPFANSTWQDYASNIFSGSHRNGDPSHQHNQMINAPLDQAPNDDFGTSHFDSWYQQAQLDFGVNEGNYNGRGGFSMPASSNQDSNAGLNQPFHQGTGQLFGNLESVLESAQASELELAGADRRK